VLPRRWVVERTFGWLMRYRRLVGDYERRPAHHEAMVLWATVAVTTRQLNRKDSGTPPPPDGATPAPPRRHPNNKISKPPDYLRDQ
jgi:hypothetical protein